MHLPCTTLACLLQDEGPMVASFKSPQALKKEGEEKEGLPWW